MAAPQYTEIDRMGRSANGRGGRKPRYFFLHTQEGDGTAESLAGYLNDPSHDASYHYTLRNGVLVDVVDTDLASWSVGDANSYAINLCFAGSRASWSRAQWLTIENDLRIAAWIAVQDARKYGFRPVWLGSGGRYSPADQGVSDHQYVTDVIGWGSHTDVGPGFPGDVFARYLAEYSGAAPTAEGDEDMPSAQEIAKAVWEQRIPTPDGKRQETAGNLLAWVDKHTGDSLDQAAGPGSKDQRGGLEPTGWPQLGQNAQGKNRSLVDAVAALADQVGKLQALIAQEQEKKA
jgi:hypothetical protein